MTDRLVNAETLAAAIHKAQPTYIDITPDNNLYEALAEAILAAIPPDPRLDALLAAAREYVRLFDIMNYPEKAAMYPTALRDALAAFDD